jgi:hypothetical protein
MPNLENKERVLKASREKYQLTYKIPKYLIITSDVSVQTQKARKAWNSTIHALRENNCQPRILSFKLDEEVKTFQDKDKLKQFMSTKPALQRILEGMIHMEQNKKQSQNTRG